MKQVTVLIHNSVMSFNIGRESCLLLITGKWLRYLRYLRWLIDSYMGGVIIDSHVA